MNISNNLNTKAPSSDQNSGSVVSIPKRVSEFNDHYFKWLYPETRQLKLPWHARVFPANGVTIREGSYVTILTGDLIRSKTAHNDPDFCRLIHAAKLVSADPSISEVFSANYLNRNLRFKNTTLNKVFEYDQKAVEQYIKLDLELETLDDQNIQEIAQMHIEYGMANCQGLCYIAIPLLAKMLDNNLEMKIIGIIGGDHAYLVLRIPGTSKSIVFDTWSGAIMPTDEFCFACLGTAIFESEENNIKIINHVPIVIPRSKKHKLSVLYQWPESQKSNVSN